MTSVVSVPEILARVLCVARAAAPAIYAIGGVLLGGWMARSNQQRQWVWDNKAREYRELVDGLFRSTEAILGARLNADTPITDALADAVWSGTRLTQNRIFVARAIEKAGIASDWQRISNVALWQPGQIEIDVKGAKCGYMRSAIIILRTDLEKKLLGLVHEDLKLLS